VLTNDEEIVPISGAELTIGSRAARFVRTLLRKPDPADLNKKRRVVRKEIEENLRRPEHDASPEIAVVRLGKEDAFGQPDLRRLAIGASYWFKFEVKGVHDRGLEVFVGAPEYVCIKRGKAYRVSRAVKSDGYRAVWVVGRIAYERIDDMDWEPDPYYSGPRLHVRFGRRGPFKEIVLYEGKVNDFLYSLDGVKYMGEGRAPWKRIGHWWRNVQMNARDRRSLREGRNSWQ